VLTVVVPLGHATHASADDAPSCVEYVASGHETHVASAEVAPSLLPYVPGPHGTHEPDDAAATAAEYVPRGHAIHADALRAPSDG
jgi:hypothetical protein